jgi:hypothetical protein
MTASPASPAMALTGASSLDLKKTWPVREPSTGIIAIRERRVSPGVTAPRLPGNIKRMPGLVPGSQKISTP